jgi:hypothetical protein
VEGSGGRGGGVGVSRDISSGGFGCVIREIEMTEGLPVKPLFVTYNRPSRIIALIKILENEKA